MGALIRWISALLIGAALIASTARAEPSGTDPRRQLVAPRADLADGSASRPPLLVP